MIVVLGDLIADISLRLPRFPVEAGSIHRLSYLELGPGGATNIAIMAARFGLPVSCLGEVGDDPFGEVVVEGLQREGIDVENIVVSPGAETPVAGVVVDVDSEPAYLGHPGNLQLTSMPEAWKQPIQAAEALFSDGWAEYEHIPGIILEGFRTARAAGVPTFFDPGPGNPDVSDEWVEECISLTTVLLANQAEITHLTGFSEPVVAGKALLEQGPELVVIKRGVAGCILQNSEGSHFAAGLPVVALDTTGAGDSLAGAMIFGYLKGLSLEALGALANATGAAKVRKLGTGHNMPTLKEIRAIMEHFSIDPKGILPLQKGE
jgi:sugar/nucleoside kinase (ribokinase family)